MPATLEPAGAPGQLHSPEGRRLVARSGAWELRGPDPRCPRTHATLRSGLLHLQLWHPEKQASLLTPSGPTGAALEVQAGCGHRWWPRTRAHVAHLCERHLGVEAPLATLDQVSASLRRQFDFELARVEADLRRSGAADCALGLCLCVLACQSAAMSRYLGESC